LRGFLTSERVKSRNQGVETRTFSDSRIEAVHQQLREAESIQAIARLRLVHNRQRKRVFILSNVLLEVHMDQLVKFDDLMPDRLEYEFLKAGNIPLTPLGLQRLRPDLAINDNQAKMLLRNSAIRNTDRLTSIHNLQKNGLIIVEFKAENNGRKRTHQHLFMMNEKAKAIEVGEVSFKMAVS
jgi:hypothetical protein